MRFVLRAALVAVLMGVCVPVRAADTVTGRWAADAAACEGGFFAQASLIVTSYGVHWQGDSCRIGRMYKAGETVHIQALCWSLAGERSVPVSLRPHGGKLALIWDRAPRGEFRRCQ